MAVAYNVQVMVSLLQALIVTNKASPEYRVLYGL